jgi:hypothetical protein
MEALANIGMMSSNSTPGAGKSGNWRSVVRRASVRRVSSAALEEAVAGNPSVEVMEASLVSLFDGGSAVVVVGTIGAGGGGGVIVEKREIKERTTEVPWMETRKSKRRIYTPQPDSTAGWWS